MCINRLSVYFVHANKGHKSKAKDSVYNTHLNFQSFFSRKKAHTTHGWLTSSYNPSSNRSNLSLGEIFNHLQTTSGNAQQTQ